MLELVDTLPSLTVELAGLVNESLQRYATFPDGCPDELERAIQYSLLSPGKRLRPILTLLAAEACGSTREAALPAACAVEMIHAYSLIHDDLPAFDDDDLRRGQPTCHVAFDEATAILAGDALLTRAFEIVANDTKPPQAANRCCVLLAQAAGACGMVGGQADDMHSDSTSDGIDKLESIHRRKTGALMLVPLQMGCVVAGGDETQLAALTNYGQQLGLAFQIVDDLLDCSGDAETVGKRTGKDADQGKLTFPGLLGMEASRQRAADLIDGACESLVPFGAAAQPLIDLARFVLSRNK